MKTVIRDIGLLLHLPAVMAIASIPVCLVSKEFYAFVPLIACIFVSLLSGQLLYRFVRVDSDTSTRLPLGMLTAACGWLFLPLYCSVPIYLTAKAMPPETIAETMSNFQNIQNALFEAYSGFTSTGLSMALKYSEIPHTIQWWRSLMEWIGGVGAIALVIALLEPATEPYKLYNAEGRSKTIGMTLSQTVKNIWWIYLLYTIASIFLFRIAGMNWWEALNHGMTGIATGGFSVTDDSIGSYGLPAKLAVIIVMVLGSISFSIHYRFFRRRSLAAFWSDNQHQALWLILFGGGGILLLFNRLSGISVPRIDSLFQWVSAVSTCGFGTTSLEDWSGEAKFLLTLAMLIGGAAGSTAGGIKLSRFVTVIKAIGWRFKRVALLPHEMMRYQLDGEAMSEAEANRRVEAAAVLAILWLTVFTIGVFILQLYLPQGRSLIDVMFEVASAISGVGISSGITSPDLPFPAKLTLICLMWMGRLEIVPVLLLFSLPFKTLSRGNK